MPAKSAKQQRFMAAVANNPKFAKKVGVPKSVGEEFMKAKKGYKAGGKLPMVKGPDGKMIPEYAADGKGKMKKGGKVKKYQMGGMASMMREAPQDESLMKGRKRRMPSMPDAPMAPPKPLPGKPKKKRQGPRGGPGMPQMPMMKSGGMAKKYKSGGKVRGCGMAKQGVRAAKMVTMKGS